MLRHAVIADSVIASIAAGPGLADCLSLELKQQALATLAKQQVLSGHAYRTSAFSTCLKRQQCAT